MRKNILGILALFGTITILILIAWVWISVSFEEKYEFTLGYVCFQIIVGGIAFGVLWKYKLWYTHTNTIASILTVIGVFGTFLGIFIGLWDFDMNDIEQSIPGLLEGLKLAFLTSLVGIGSAILLKGVTAPLFQIFQKDRNPVEVERDKFIDALIRIETSGEMNLRAQLVTLNTTIEKEGSETREVLDNIKTSLAGKHDELIRLQAEGHRETHEMLTSMKTEIVSIKSALTGENESTVFAQLQELTSTVSEKVGEIASKVGEIATGQLDVENHVNILHNALRKEVNTLHESLEKELDISLQTLAGYFESLSNGFVNNYTELIASYTQIIAELQQLVNASRRGVG